MRASRAGRVLAGVVAVLLVTPTAVTGQERGEDRAGQRPDGQDPVGFDRDGHAGHGMEVALAHVAEARRGLGLQPGDLADVLVTDVVVDEDTDTTHVYLQQRHRGIQIAGAVTNVSVASDDAILTVGNRFFPALRAVAPPQRPARAARQGVEDAARALGVDGTPGRAVERRGGPSQQSVFAEGQVSSEPVVTQLAYVPDGRRLPLAWSSTITHPMTGRTTTVLTDTDDGTELGRVEHTHDATDTSSYTVWPTPTEAPSFGPRSTLTSPADAAASPYGWHDTDGITGPEHTVTIGNNVHAGIPASPENSAPAPGTEPDGGPSLTFDFPYDATVEAAVGNSNADAVVTNLFYWNNTLHDVLYRHGFDEDAGNFQTTNYTGDGAAGDPVIALAQHWNGSVGNFSTPPDGQSPVMRLGIMNPLRKVTVEVTEPAAATYAPDRTRVSPTDVGNVEGRPFELVDDGVGDPTDACTDISGFTAGNIALITPTPVAFPAGPDNDNCFLGDAVRRATDAGAAAVIVLRPSGWGLYAETVPVVDVTDADGQALLASLPATGSVVAEPAHPLVDIALDNGVVAHEYGHGLSIRLVGGPSTVGCLSTAEQMGEGWSDMLGLIMTARGDGQADRTRSYSTYMFGQQPDGPGARGGPYSTDTSVSPWVYDDLKQSGQSHFVGMRWAAMMWEVYWNLIDAHGFNPDLSADWNTGGNNLALRLMIDGMKLTPCGPGFVDARDAVLAADVNLTGGANQCAIWRGFAKRGLGTGADQGFPDWPDDGTSSFDVPQGLGCLLEACLTPTIVGGPDDDVILGTPGDDVIVALDGNNTILSGAGDDTICTGNGDDTIDAGDGDDSIEAGAGNNQITTGAGDDTVEAGDGDNTIRLGPGDDYADTGNGTDTIDGGDGDDRCLARGDTNTLTSCEWTEVAWTVDADPPGRPGSPALYSGIALNYDEAVARPVQIPRGNRATLTLQARWNLEQGFDFGFVQLSTDGGATWTSLDCTDTTSETGQPDFPEEQAIPAVLENLPGFTGDSGGWRTQDCDVTDHAGQRALLAFRVISDHLGMHGPDRTIPTGFWVDDVTLANKTVSDGTHLYGWE